MYIYIYIYVFVVITCTIVNMVLCTHMILHSAKGGAVETGCSDVYGVIH